MGSLIGYTLARRKFKPLTGRDPMKEKQMHFLETGSPSLSINSKVFLNNSLTFIYCPNQ
ncbi:hypothetical protein NCCP133_14570 [Cytobacillus sp. NCCP-133]|nr:hypothetical protein NCCP133_14570 [Cytobacillus sp. NCCP-133]